MKVIAQETLVPAPLSAYPSVRHMDGENIACHAVFITGGHFLHMSTGAGHVPVIENPLKLHEILCSQLQRFSIFKIMILSTTRSHSTPHYKLTPYGQQ